MNEERTKVNRMALYIEDYKTGKWEVIFFNPSLLPISLGDIASDVFDYKIPFGLNINEYFIFIYLSSLPNVKVERLPLSTDDPFDMYRRYIFEEKYKINYDILFLKGVPDLISTNYEKNTFTFYEIKFGNDWLNKNQIEWLNKTGYDLKIIMLAPCSNKERDLTDEEIRNEILKNTKSGRKK